MPQSPVPDCAASPFPRYPPSTPATPAQAANPDPLNPTVFHESWWLDAAAPAGWGEVTVTATGRTVGRLPYLLRHQSLGRTSCIMPDLCHFLGPAVDAGTGAACNRSLRRDQIIRDLLEHLPAAGLFSQRMHRGIQDVMIFAELDFTTLVQFTFEIAPDHPDRLWANMRDKTRNIIRRAQDRCTVSDSLSPADFAAFYIANAAASGHPCYYSAADIARVTERALARNRGRILSAIAPDGTHSAAIFILWDRTSCYYLLSMRDRGRDEGATSLLLWDAIRLSAAMGLTFDFDGLLTRGNRVFFTGFGGTVHPRYIATRRSTPFRIANQIATRLDRIGATLGPRWAMQPQDLPFAPFRR